MTASTWLNEIQARATALGMSPAELARAAGMRPNNLRRLLMSSPESPRLESVMRLLDPLGCRVGPAGARTAAELAAFLDAVRQRRGESWTAVLTGSKVRAKIAERLGSAPEMLSLGVVLEIASKLGVELTIEGEEPAPAHARGGTRRPRTAHSRGAADLQRDARARPIAESTPSSDLATDRSSPTPTTVSREEPTSPWSLRPPRLGRYRDEPPVARTGEPPPVTIYTPPSSPYTLERALLGKLADLTEDDWNETYTSMYQFFTGAAKAPGRVVARMASATERWFRGARGPRVRAPEPAPPEDISFADTDPTPLVRAWMESKAPDYRSRDTSTKYDELGRAHVVHLALDNVHVVAIRLAQGDRPHQIAQVIHVPHGGEFSVLSEPDVPLVVRLGEEHHRFAHVHAGPVFAELRLPDRALLLAAISWAIVLVQADAGGSRVLWGGSAGQFAGVVVEARPSGAPSQRLAEPTPDPGEPSAALSRELEEEMRQRAARESELTAVKQDLADERALRAKAQQDADEARAVHHNAEREHRVRQQELMERNAALINLEETSLVTLALVIAVAQSASRELKEARERLTETVQVAEEASAQRDALARENANFQRQLTESIEKMEVKFSTLVAKADAIERTRDDFVTGLNAKYHQAEGKREALERQCEALRGQLAKIATREAAASKALKALEDENAALRRQLAQPSAMAAKQPREQPQAVREAAPRDEGVSSGPRGLDEDRSTGSGFGESKTTEHPAPVEESTRPAEEAPAEIETFEPDLGSTIPESAAVAAELAVEREALGPDPNLPTHSDTAAPMADRSGPSKKKRRRRRRRR